MASREDIEGFRRSLDDVVALARRELMQFWRSLDHTLPAAALLAAVESFMADLVPVYGDVAATLAADWFEQVVPGVAGVVPVLSSDKQIRSSARWAASNLYTGRRNPADALAGAADRLVKQAARSTVARGVAANDGVRYARVPRGATTCAFCTVLASRGAVYRSTSSAGGFGKYSNTWHDHCDCAIVPVRSDSDLPGDYDVDHFYSIYQQGRSAAGSGDFKQILAGVRSVSGLH